jgi:hypothetical protein
MKLSGGTVPRLTMGRVVTFAWSPTYVDLFVRADLPLQRGHWVHFPILPPWVGSRIENRKPCYFSNHVLPTCYLSAGCHDAPGDRLAISTRTLSRQGLIDYLAELPARAHGAIIYNEDSIRYPLMFGYLESGLASNWYCLFATMAESSQPVKERMRKYGLDPDGHGQDLAVKTGRELFGTGSEPDWDLWIRNIDEVVADAKRRGKRGFRWAGELPNHFLRIGKLDRWFRMEEAFDERAPNYSVLCAYDSRTSFGQSVIDVYRYYRDIPVERRRFADMHSFSIFSLDPDTHHVMENFPNGLHPGYELYPRAVGSGWPSADGTESVPSSDGREPRTASPT